MQHTIYMYISLITPIISPIESKVHTKVSIVKSFKKLSDMYLVLDRTFFKHISSTLTDPLISLFYFPDLPKFGELLQNVTVPVSREAVLQCVVDNLQTYKVSSVRLGLVRVGSARFGFLLVCQSV